MNPTKVIFTIDTEHGCGGVPYKISGDLTQFGIKENFGINAIMDIFEKYDMKAVFFTNVYETDTFDAPYENYMQTICKDISSRGHELALHWHSLGVNTSKFQSLSPTSLSLEEQTKMIQKGVEYVEKYGGVKPISYRAGAYRANEDTFIACARNGIKFESSMWFGNPNNDVSAYKSISAPYNIDELTEVPIVSVISHFGKNTKLDFDCLHLEQIIEAFHNMRKMNFPIIQIMFHSFSLLKKADGESKPLFVCKDKKYVGGDLEKKQKLNRLLSYLQLSPDFEVVTFRDIEDVKFDFSKVEDGFVPTNFRNSIETAVTLTNANLKIIPKENIRLDVPVHQYSLYYDAEKKNLRFVLKEILVDAKFAYYLQDETGKALQTIGYGDSSDCEFTVEQNGKYRVKFYIQNKTGKVSYNTKFINIKGGEDIELDV